MRTLRLLAAVLLAIGSVLVAATPAQAAGAPVVSMTINAVADRGGLVAVTQTMTYDFGSSGGHGPYVYWTTRQAIEFDARRALFILGVISLSLAIINLFPFLPLDGGHIFWSIVEKVRGKPVSFSVMERASVLGILLVAMLFVIGLSNDIGRLNGEGFDIR